MPRPKDDFLRDRILKYAARNFFRNGIYKVSIDQIVAEAKTSKAAVYNFFPSKSRLAEAVLLKLNDTINSSVSAIVYNDNLRFPDKLEAIARFTSKILKEVNTLFLEDLENHYPHLWKKYLSMREDRLNSLYLSLFKDGVNLGFIRKDVPLDFILMIYTKLTEIVVNPKHISALGLSKDKAYAMLSKLFLEGAKP